MKMRQHRPWLVAALLILTAPFAHSRQEFADEVVKIPIVEAPILHNDGGTAALSPESLAVRASADHSLQALVNKIRESENAYEHKYFKRYTSSTQSGFALMSSKQSACTWVKTGNPGGNYASKDYQLFMAKMFVKHMCNPVSPITLRAAPFGSYDAFINKDFKILHSIENDKAVIKKYDMQKDSLENLIPLFSLMYAHGLRESQGNPAEPFDKKTKDNAQPNLEQGMFHVASNTLNYDATINHPEMIRIYSEYFKKIKQLSIDNEMNELQKLNTYEDLCSASNFESNYKKSLTDNHGINKVVPDKTLSQADSGTKIAWTSIKNYLSSECAQSATGFIAKVNRNISHIVTSDPVLAHFVEEQRYQSMVEKLENLRKRIEGLEEQIEAKKINMHLSETIFENQITFIRSTVQKITDIESRRKIFDQELKINTERLTKLNLEDFHKGEKQAALNAENVRSVERINSRIKQYSENLKKVDANSARGSELKDKITVQQILLQSAERDLKKSKESQILREKLYAERTKTNDALVADRKLENNLRSRLTEAQLNILPLSAKLTSLKKDYETQLASLTNAKKSNEDFTNLLNKARQEASSMAFFSLDNTDYDKSKIDVNGFEEQTAICFGALATFCPAFSVDYHSVTMRTNRAQFGPLNKTPKGLTPACSNMFEEIWQNKANYCKVDQIVVK